jgi:Short C-terminal domain/Phospholipase_D-nuclease N-terminal
VLGDADDPLLANAEPVSGAGARERIASSLPGAIASGLPAAKGGEMPLAASSYPLLNVFWTIFEIFLWVIWIWILIWIFIDIFRSRDLSGWAKALWFLFVLFIPLIGVLVYLIVRGGSMHERAVQDARQQDQEFRQYVQQAAASGPASTADQLTKLADLRDRGVISPEEFEREKAKVLGSTSAS